MLTRLMHKTLAAALIAAGYSAAAFADPTANAATPDVPA